METSPDGRPRFLAYFGHHKCATVWIHKIISEVCKSLSLKSVYIHSAGSLKGGLAEFVAEQGIDFLTYANAKIGNVAPLRGYRGFHAVRDPRDLVVSSYFSHLNSHPTSDWPALGEFRKRLAGASKEEGLMMDMDFIDRDVLRPLEAWDYGLPHVLEIKVEDLTSRPLEMFTAVFSFLGIIGSEGNPSTENPLSVEALNGILLANSFEVLSGGRKAGQEDHQHHFRKGVAGDWRNHFTPAVKDAFKKRYGGLLLKLGYESDASW
jgi:hypothetical protein